MQKEIRKSAEYQKLSGDNKDRYDAKIMECGGIDPYTIKDSELSIDTKDLPHITLTDLGNYMINSISPFTKRFYDNYKGAEAYTFFKSGFVLSLGCKKNVGLAIIKGEVYLDSIALK